MNDSDEKLIESARKAREYAHAPFSHFKVGAALLTADNKIFSGCNIENATFGLTICAERTAIFKAVSEGKKDFKKICVVADTEILTPPCGACRQIIWEFCGDIKVVLANLKGQIKVFRMESLFPEAFDANFLQSE